MNSVMPGLTGNPAKPTKASFERHWKTAVKARVPGKWNARLIGSS
jgi:hypothetical protein